MVDVPPLRHDVVKRPPPRSDQVGDGPNHRKATTKATEARNMRS
jgi:hypothetical protein